MSVLKVFCFIALVASSAVGNDYPKKNRSYGNKNKQDYNIEEKKSNHELDTPGDTKIPFRVLPFNPWRPWDLTDSEANLTLQEIYDFKDSYSDEEWKEITMNLEKLGITHIDGTSLMESRPLEKIVSGYVICQAKNKDICFGPFDIDTDEITAYMKNMSLLVALGMAIKVIDSLVSKVFSWFAWKQFKLIKEALKKEDAS